MFFYSTTCQFVSPLPSLSSSTARAMTLRLSALICRTPYSFLQCVSKAMKINRDGKAILVGLS